MSFLVGNKKRFIVTIMTLCIAFVLTMIWSVFTYMYLSNESYQERQSYVIAEQYKLLYENDRRAIKSVEPVLDNTLKRTLKDVSADIKEEDNIDIQYLNHLTAEYGITGIWLIEEDKMVHLSSEGIKNTDAAQWYKDRPEVEWEKKIDWLLANGGSVWIDSFSKRNTPPHTYLKWAYMGLGEVPQLGGKIILEIGMSVEDAFSISQLESVMMNNEMVSQNIADAEIILTNPTDSDSKVDEYQNKEGDFFITSVKAKDFNNQDTQILIKTQFPEIENENRGVLIICIGSTIFTLLCFGLLLAGILRRKI
jgi:hypothetical protein